MVGCPEALTGAEKGLEKGLVWRETTTMPLTTRPASTATVIRRSDTGSVPGPDVPTAGRERVSIQGSPAHGRLGRPLVPDPGKARRAAQRGGRRRAHLDAAGAELVLQHVHVHRGGNAGAGLLLAAPGQERRDGQAQPRQGEAGRGDRAYRPPAAGQAQ